MQRRWGVYFFLFFFLLAVLNFLRWIYFWLVQRNRNDNVWQSSQKKTATSSRVIKVAMQQSLQISGRCLGRFRSFFLFRLQKIEITSRHSRQRFRSCFFLIFYYILFLEISYSCFYDYLKKNQVGDLKHKNVFLKNKF